MTVASTIVNEALTLAGASSAISPPEPEQQQTAFAVLVDLLNLWSKETISLGENTTVPSAIGDDIAEDAWATGPLKAVLAMEVCPYFRIDPPPSLWNLVEKGRTTILIHGAPDEQPSYPGNLPTGAGNANPYGRVFFPEPDQT